MKKSLLAGCLAAATSLPPATAQAAAQAAAQAGGKPTRSGAGLIDSYCHFSLMSLIDFLEQNGGRKPHVFRSLFANTPTLIDPEQRLRLMDKAGVERSVLVPLPWIETAPPVWANAQLCSQAAQIFNDGLARIVAKWPDRFIGVGLLPTTNQEVLIPELTRVVKELGFAGGFFVVGPTAKRPDHPDLEALYQAAAGLDVPLWLHPSRPPTIPDYVDEKFSKYQVWQGFSWLLDTSTAMVRIVFSGVFDRYPELKLIIHHHGALVPLFAQRMQYGWDYFEQNTGVKQPTKIKAPYIDHFKKFYCDTATQGDEPLLLQIAWQFFGPERMLFGSDAPMDPTSGTAFTADALASVQGMEVPAADKKLILAGNAKRVLKLS